MPVLGRPFGCWVEYFLAFAHPYNLDGRGSPKSEGASRAGALWKPLPPSTRGGDQKL
jgi:hypothetical protein